MAIKLPIIENPYLVINVHNVWHSEDRTTKPVKPAFDKMGVNSRSNIWIIKKCEEDNGIGVH